MASREVLLDTSALYAFVNNRELLHSATCRAIAALAKAGKYLLTSDYLIAETVNLANAREGHYMARQVLRVVEQSQGLRLEWIGPARFNRAKAWLRRYADHDFSFTDCTSFVLMRELGLTEALTTDRHFQAAGFKVLGPAAPRH